jgi:hypothetical protein
MILTEFYDEVDHLKEDVLAKRVAEIRDSQGPRLALGYQKALHEFRDLSVRNPYHYQMTGWLCKQIELALKVPIENPDSEFPYDQGEALKDLALLVKRDPDRNWVSPLFQKKLRINHSPKPKAA